MFFLHLRGAVKFFFVIPHFFFGGGFSVEISTLFLTLPYSEYSSDSSIYLKVMWLWSVDLGAEL